ncbi:microcin C transport system permease protein [Prosthecobacter fusiformis]|uniref:Microcin C transport system permease protein n=1 Tax=Prosthecobacter fusiformis TaxID=48464 RepID=A0A4R7RT84_9BACT|nr:ABC transporter permease subunit [Prosthecobacter fusiformis]TDU68005.1 microcin C transport system permease protein [Prosthecobacter fusiformis]
MTPRTLGIALTIFAFLAALFRWLGFLVPVFKLPFLGGAWAGWILVSLCGLAGLRLLLKGQREWQFSPLTLKQFRRFRSLRRGYISFLILLSLAGGAALDNLIVGKRALVVSHAGSLYFPFLRSDVIPGKTFGLEYDAETNYRELKRVFEKEDKGWVLLPPVPYAPSLDSEDIIETLEKRTDGQVYQAGSKEAFNGRAYTVFKSKPEQKRQEFTYRAGLLQGEMRGWDAEGEQVERARYDHGQRVEFTDYTLEKTVDSLTAEAGPDLLTIIYPPSPPSWSQGHYLGTNASGLDVLAVLYGGLQQALIAATLFVTFVFVVGIFVGGVAGYFGGWLDLIAQRLIEIWGVLPFLFVVMIVSSLIQPTLVILVGIIAMFGWMGTATYLRTATYREKARDYVASARLLGASTGRVLFKHILPNTIAILVTLAPFEIAGVITSLAALDFLGFGLPPEVPSWGRLLHEGTESFNYPWIVSAAFSAMVGTLILVTFVGEAVREAFDPKKFTTYR